jgi:hypothetical protein
MCVCVLSRLNCDGRDNHYFPIYLYNSSVLLANHKHYWLFMSIFQKLSEYYVYRNPLAVSKKQSPFTLCALSFY